MSFYCKLGGEDGHEVLPCDDIAEFGKHLATEVAKTSVGPYYVSTAFIGYGEAPFETMVFWDANDDEQGYSGDSVGIEYRTCTWADAESMHRRVVEEVREGLPDPAPATPEVQSTVDSRRIDI
jgi:hypothetical protein